CGPRAFSRHLLPSGQLGAAGTDHGPRQGRSHQPAESFSQRRTGLSAHPAVSRLTARRNRMKSPQPEGAPAWEISIEELEALVEQVRAVLPEDGYQKL